MNTYYVYMMASNNNHALYIGVTNNLPRRVYEHKTGILAGFTEKYNVHKLVWCESCHDIKSAIAREKQLKRWSRSKKEMLINKMNPEWADLSR
ncbi:GIY-YIG nuclease family protein [Aristaeella lactis]|uniref:Endonuclease n=1 Tax=Aristaeella lactis TaxID=3046383 RepID=A0AC61PLJ0_9FIRM|nr:GIY-YIG nuclease family protein [Succinimonas sp.]QUA52234.1 GIY-YIG nuclease family protein [Aristaeella lactis]SMC59312.1 putative endonuclease [Aristaeella lactis]